MGRIVANAQETPQVPEPELPRPTPEAQAPTAGRAGWRWLAIWVLLTGVYAALGLAYRTLAGAVPLLRAEDVAHWATVPAIQTAALALVARLRRRS